MLCMCCKLKNYNSCHDTCYESMPALKKIITIKKIDYNNNNTNTSLCLTCQSHIEQTNASCLHLRIMF